MRPARAARLALAAAAAFTATACGAARTVSAGDAASPLRLARTIALPDTRGRIDHLAVDLAHRLLFVAEYGNGSVDVVDLAAGKVVDRIAGLREPQGVGVTLDGTQLAVACGDGSVRFYGVRDRRPVAALALGKDADNVRIDPRQGHVVVGFGDGALAVIDPASHEVLARLALPAHPEGFRLDDGRVFVNLPDRGAIAAADLDAFRVTASWPTGLRRLNFPLALDPAGRWFATAYRLPATLEVRDRASGAVLSARGACGDADDLFVDGDRFYLVCGTGHVDVLPTPGGKDTPVSVVTAPGARTGLFVPELHVLFVAAPARGGVATIREFVPRRG